MDREYKYFAFISYSSRDTKWGKRLERKLSNYKMSATLCHERGWKRKPLAPVFFAPYDIQPGGLSEELQQRLREARHLIVICSPNSARSAWVGKEIEYFHRLGRTDRIHFFIIDGEPHSGNEATECFNPAIEKLGLPEILGANIHEKVYRWPWLNKQRAYVQLITKLLGVEFDSVWQRHKRQLIRQSVVWGLGIAAVVALAAGIWLGSRPVDVRVSLNELTAHNADLPPLRDARVTMMLDNETKTDTVASLAHDAVFANIPHRFLGREVRFIIECRDYLPVDTTVVMAKEVALDVRRDASVYGDVRFRVWDPDKETFVSNVKVQIAGHELTTGSGGEVRLELPIEQQRQAYGIAAEVPLAADSIRMPTGEDDVVCVR